jgi:hypothetical protein
MLLLKRSLIGACLLTRVLLAQEPTAVKEYAIPNHGTLRLAIPDSWQVTSKPVPQPASTVFHITPKKGDAFDLQLTAVWLDAPAFAKTTAQSIKGNVQRSAEAMLPQAVEKIAAMQELRGTQSVGSFYTLTDRNPAPGEYKYLTQGSFLTGEVLAVFTVLSRVPGTPEVGQALRMFADANYSK